MVEMKCKKYPCELVSNSRLDHTSVREGMESVYCSTDIFEDCPHHTAVFLARSFGECSGHKRGSETGYNLGLGLAVKMNNIGDGV